MPKVMIGQRGHIVNLTPAEVIGAGGEGTIFGKGGVAYKIYDKPTRQRAEKLSAFLSLGVTIPPEVVAPQELVYDTGGGRVIGFTMRLLPSGLQVLETLTNRKHRETSGVSTRDVTDIFIRLHQVLDTLHPGGIVVGDLNYLNELCRKTDLAMIDADSYQFGSFPCPVATPRCLDPRLYGVDLSLRPVFIPNDDWYAYLVLLFNSLLLTHPYGGTHRGLRTILLRAQAKVTVLDSSVIYPNIAYPQEVVSDDLMHLFAETFAKGRRGKPRLDLLTEYRAVLIGCPTCRLWYPHQRKKCPGCQALNQLAQRMQKVVRGARAIELLVTPGNISSFKLIGATMYAVTVEQGKAVLYIKESLAKAKRMELFKATTDARYDFFGNYMVVCEEPYAKNPKLLIFDIAGTKPVSVVKTVTQCFGNRGAIFRCSATHLYRVLTGGTIVRGDIRGRNLVDETVGTGMDSQTWLDAASDPGQEIAFGFYRVFKKHEWFLIRDKRQYRVGIPALEVDETMTDRTIRFSASSLVLLRKTRQAGEEFCRIDVVDIASSQVISSRRVSLIDNPQFTDIHTCAYKQGVILIPTDDGLLAENVETGQQRTFPDTAQYVSAGDSLWPFEEGSLAVSINRAT
ncbi:MAG: hypothetical protein FJ044_04480, partial [Candidatus Cloacimonetes bacterium]|nr:hypothetical protein [Candidatus Cloacimonadota bacterium]